MPNAPISESWFAEKSSIVVEQLARALAAARHVEDEVLREYLVAVLETAMLQAMKIAAAGRPRGSWPPWTAGWRGCGASGRERVGGEGSGHLRVAPPPPPRGR